MATFTAEKLSGLVQALDFLDLPNPFGKNKRERSPSPASLLHPFSSSSVPKQHKEPLPPSERTTLLQQSISALPPSKPTREQLQHALKALAGENESEPSTTSLSEVDTYEEDVLAWTLLGRLVLGLYGQTVEDLVESAGLWEDEIAWWRALDAKGRWSWGGTGGYLFMSEVEASSFAVAQRTHTGVGSPPA